MAGNIYPDWTPSDYTLSGWLAGEAASDRDWALKQRMGLDNLFRQGEIDKQQLENTLERQTQADKIRKMTGEADSAVAKGTMEQFKVPYEKQGIIDADKLNKGVNVLRDMLETVTTTNDINAAHQAAIAAGADPNKLGHLKDRKAIADALQRAEQRLMDTPDHQRARQLKLEEEFGKNWREVYKENQANYRARLNADRFGSGGGGSGTPPRYNIEQAIVESLRQAVASGQMTAQDAQAEYNRLFTLKATAPRIQPGIAPQMDQSGNISLQNKGWNPQPQAPQQRKLTPEQRAAIIEELRKRNK